MLARAPSYSGLRPAEIRLRRFLLLCGLLAVVVAAAAQLVMPARGDPVLVWITVVFLPAVIVCLIAVLGRGPRALASICGLIYLQGILLAALYAIALAFAILLPMIAVGIAQPHIARRPRLVLYGSAVLAASATVLLVELGVPENPLGLENALLATTAFVIVGAFALGVTWRSQEQLTEALGDAETEIEARIAAEAVARETADELDRLIRSSAVATIVLDNRGRVVVWNPAAAVLCGEAEEAVLGQPLPLVDLSAGAASSSLTSRPESLATRLLKAETIEGDTALVECRTGRRVNVEIHSAPRYDDGGARFGTIVQLVDVTERTRLEAELRQAQKMEAIGHVAGGIAHDINNTLTAVGGFAELIESETTDPAIRSDAEMIAGSTRRAADLTRRLLAFARRSVLRPQVIDVSSFLVSVEPVLQNVAGDRIDVEVVDAASGTSIEIDAAQLVQALLNVATNAREAMPSGGRLTLEARRDEIKRSDGSTVPAVLLAMADTGGGIPEEAQARVWEPFFTTKGRAQGTGLGLAMVHGFVAQSGGTVALSSAPGQGTTIEIRLPETTAAGAPATPSEGTNGRGGNETILLVEDEPPVAEVGRRVLTGLGYRVIEAHDGTEALALASAEQGAIDLVLTDVVMPGMSGPQMADAVHEIHPEAAILYVSGFSGDAVAERGVLTGGLELVNKPYSSGELATRVRAALDKRRA